MAGVTVAPVVAQDAPPTEVVAGTRDGHFSTILAELQGIHEMVRSINARVLHIEDFVNNCENLASNAPRLPFGPDFSKIVRK